MSKTKEFRMLKFSQVNEQLYSMKGKILTLIDATVPDKQQNKATKDFIHDIVGTTRNLFWRHAIGEEVFPKSEKSSR